MLSIHSKFILKISGLQFNWFDKVKYTKVSLHRGMSPGIQEKTTHNKSPEKNSLWETRVQDRNITSFELQELACRDRNSQGSWERMVSHHLRNITSFCTASQEQKLKTLGLREKPFQQSC